MCFGEKEILIFAYQDTRKDSSSARKFLSTAFRFDVWKWSTAHFQRTSANENTKTTKKLQARP